eukprot:264824-Rhodomonas_salina.3
MLAIDLECGAARFEQAARGTKSLADAQATEKDSGRIGSACCNGVSFVSDAYQQFAHKEIRATLVGASLPPRRQPTSLLEQTPRAQAEAESIERNPDCGGRADAAAESVTGRTSRETRCDCGERSTDL